MPSISFLFFFLLFKLFYTKKKKKKKLEIIISVLIFNHFSKAKNKKKKKKKLIPHQNTFFLYLLLPVSPLLVFYFIFIPMSFILYSMPSYRLSLLATCVVAFYFNLPLHSPLLSTLIVNKNHFLICY